MFYIVLIMCLNVEIFKQPKKDDDYLTIKPNGMTF